MRTDTIAAIATAMSSSGIGIIRISGDEAVGIVDRIFSMKNGKKLSDMQTHTIHYGHIKDVDEVIDEKVGCHPSYIWRVMKNTKDMTFTDYVAGQKLEMAKRMLVETDLSVAEIAERLSYSNAQNFIRLFKKHMDITPGQYRKQYK